MWISFENIRKNGVAIIMVSHYLDEVEALADKILYLEKGKQQFFGTKQGFREYVKSLIPQNEWNDNYSLELSVQWNLSYLHVNFLAFSLLWCFPC